MSIASRETFNSIQEGESTLELAEPTVKLQTYTGEPIRVCGTTQVQVKHKEQTATAVGHHRRKWANTTRPKLARSSATRLAYHFPYRHESHTSESSQSTPRCIQGRAGRASGSNSKNPRKPRCSASIRESSSRTVRHTSQSGTRAGPTSNTRNHQTSPVFRLGCADCTRHETRRESENLRGL